MELLHVRRPSRNRVYPTVFDPGPQGTDTRRQIDVVGRRQKRPLSTTGKTGKTNNGVAGRRYSRPDRVRDEPVRRASGRRVKIHRSYSVEEAARCVGVHKNTVRRWLKSGLSAIDSRRPALIHGAALRAFLDAARRSNRHRCNPGELFCLRCRVPRTPAAGMLDYLPITDTSGKFRGLCGICEALMHRRVALVQISVVKGNCDVAFPQGQQRIGDSNDTSLNVDFAAIGQTRDNEQR